MGKLNVTDFFIYRWRYWIGYSIIGLALIGVLVFAGLYLPGGLSQQEMNAVVKSDAIAYGDISSVATTNLPYHMLQQASLSLFGVSTFSIKLPSLILGFLTAVSLIVLLRRWFAPNIAVLASMIVVTTGQFLYVAQSGTAGILYAFWSVTLLLLGTFIAKRTKPKLLWKSLFFITVALSLYTPLSIYILVALGSAVLLHPHLRYIIRRLSKKKLLFALTLSVLLLIPLVIGIVRQPQLGLTLLGVPRAWPDIFANIAQLGQDYFGFMTSGNSTLMMPVFGLGSMILILYGFYNLLKTRNSVQSYIVLTWLICLLPVLVINPTFTSVMFVPLVLLLATGLSTLLATWYRLFPFNPYARIAGLLPLIVLVSSLVLFGLERYVYGYHYAPAIVANFSHDLQLLPNATKILKVSSDELPFYTVVARHKPELTVQTKVPTADTFTATRKARIVSRTYHIGSIVTDYTTSDADRFYVYKKITK